MVCCRTAQARSRSPSQDVQRIAVMCGGVSSLRARSRTACRWCVTCLLLLLLVHQGLVPEGHVILVSAICAMSVFALVPTSWYSLSEHGFNDLH